jgi:hypothetical protein
MNIFSATAIAFTSASAAAYAVSKFIGQLKHSDRLKEAVLNWVTQPKDPISSLFDHYVIIRRRLYGDSVFAWRRSRFIISIFCLIWLAELALVLTDPHSEGRLLIDWMRYYPHVQWFIVSNFPIASVVLLALSFGLAHLSFFLFDQITLKSKDFGNRLYLYLLLLLASYAVVYVFVAMFSAVLAFAPALGELGITDIGWFAKYVVSAPIRVPSHMASLIASEISPVVAPNGKGDFGDAILTIGSRIINRATLVGVYGTCALCLSAMLVASFLNVLYATALALVRLDYFLRVKFKWNTTELYKNPIEYLSFIAGTLTFLIAFASTFVPLLYH